MKKSTILALSLVLIGVALSVVVLGPRLGLTIIGSNSTGTTTSSIRNSKSWSAYTC